MKENVSGCFFPEHSVLSPSLTTHTTAGSNGTLYTNACVKQDYVHCCHCWPFGVFFCHIVMTFMLAEINSLNK